MIAWCPCTPPSTMETFGEKISAEACSGKEIAGLLRKMMMMMNNYDDTKIVKSRVSGFSRAKPEAGRNGLSLCIARDGPESCCWRVLKAKLTILAEFEGFLCADDVIFDLRHPYIEHLPML